MPWVHYNPKSHPCCDLRREHSVDVVQPPGLHGCVPWVHDVGVVLGVVLRVVEVLVRVVGIWRSVEVPVVPVGIVVLERVLVLVLEHLQGWVVVPVSVVGGWVAWA